MELCKIKVYLEDLQQHLGMRAILWYFSKHPSTTLWTAEIRLGLRRKYNQPVLQNRLHLFLYRLYILQELLKRDYDTWVEFSNWCVKNIELDAFFSNRVRFLWWMYLSRASKSELILWKFWNQKIPIKQERFPKTLKGSSLMRSGKCSCDCFNLLGWANNHWRDSSSSADYFSSISYHMCLQTLF